MHFFLEVEGGDVTKTVRPAGLKKEFKDEETGENGVVLECYLTRK